MTQFRLSVFFLFFALLLISSVISYGAETKAWPQVQPLHERRTFVDLGKSDRDTPLILFVNDLKGIPAYKLECHNGNYDIDTDLSFSGDFQCALFALREGKRTGWNLAGNR